MLLCCCEVEVDMLLVTMMLAAVSLSDLIDPCHPPAPCVPHSNMSDPHGDCSVFFVCQPSTRLWKRTKCSPQNNETRQFDSVTGHCLVASLNATCRQQCPGQQLHSLLTFSAFFYSVLPTLERIPSGKAACDNKAGFICQVFFNQHRQSNGRLHDL